MYKIFIIIFLCLNNLGLKSQNCFNLDSVLEELNHYAGVERHIASYNFYEGLIGCKIPAFTAKSIDGEIISSDSLVGKVIVINFWFIDCAPCIAELPQLNELVHYYKNKDNIEFLGLSIDDSAYIAKAFIGKYKFDFKIVPHAEYIAHQFCVLGYPKTYIIDRQGKIRKVFIGLKNS